MKDSVYADMEESENLKAKFLFYPSFLVLYVSPIRNIPFAH